MPNNTTNYNMEKPITNEFYDIAIGNSNLDLIDAQMKVNADHAIGKNVLINSSGITNQREVSGTVVLAAGEYGHDRMKAGASGCEYTFVESESVVTYTILTGSLMQEIIGENLITSNYRASWIGESQAQIDGAGYTSNPFTTAIIGGNNSQLEFNNNGTGTLILPKFEVGTIETTNIPQKQNITLDECRAYYVEFNALGLTRAIAGDGASASTTIAYYTIKFPVKMISSPTLVLSADSDWSALDNVSLFPASAVILWQPENYFNGFSMSVRSTNAGLTAFRPYRLVANNANARMAFDAEV